MVEIPITTRRLADLQTALGPAPIQSMFQQKQPERVLPKYSQMGRAVSGIFKIILQFSRFSSLAFHIFVAIYYVGDMEGTPIGFGLITSKMFAMYDAVNFLLILIFVFQKNISCWNKILLKCIFLILSFPLLFYFLFPNQVRTILGGFWLMAGTDMPINRFAVVDLVAVIIYFVTSIIILQASAKNSPPLAIWPHGQR